MARPFKCMACGCEETHKVDRIYDGADKPISTDAIVALNSYMFDFRTVMRACKDCGTVKAYWEKITESDEVTEVDKGRVRDLQKRKDNVAQLEKENSDDENNV